MQKQKNVTNPTFMKAVIFSFSKPIVIKLCRNYEAAVCGAYCIIATGVSILKRVDYITETVLLKIQCIMRGPC